MNECLPPTLVVCLLSEQNFQERPTLLSTFSNLPLLILVLSSLCLLPLHKIAVDNITDGHHISQSSGCFSIFFLFDQVQVSIAFLKHYLTLAFLSHVFSSFFATSLVSPFVVVVF